MNSEIRELFPVTKEYVYLNHAAVCPISLPVAERMLECTSDLLNHGFVHFEKWGNRVKKVRQLAAQFINAEESEIAFAPNTSSGLAFVANGLNWKSGDNIVTADCEFPANLMPWRRVSREYGVELRMAREREGRLDAEEILSLIDSRTRVVSLSFVEYASGFRNDLAKIGSHCRERGVLFVVDAIQGLGALKLDVQACSIDALSADAHKFLLGPDGVALFYVSRQAMELIQPTVVGWMSVANPFDFINANQPYAAAARRFEPGALNTVGITGLGAAIELFLQIGLERIENHLLELGGYLSERLTARGYQVVSSRRPGEGSAVVCCRHDKFSADELYRILNEQHIITTPRLGRLRISPHLYNTREDIDRLIETLPS
jgi:cysteine desulfurase/selenocysteine lyase